MAKKQLSSALRALETKVRGLRGYIEEMATTTTGNLDDMQSVLDAARDFEESILQAEFESLRHRLSPALDGTSEKRPLETSIVIGENDDENCGLSSLELPEIDKIFELEGDGTIWYHMAGENDACDPAGPVWHDIDELAIEDMREVVDRVCNG